MIHKDPMSFLATRSWAVAAFCTVFLSVTGSAQKTEMLADSDLSVAGFGNTIDSNEARRVLGPPITRDGLLWHYDGLLIHFGATPNIWYIRLVDSRYATRRGLRVGDRVDRITALYGQPWDRGEGIYRYRRAVGNRSGRLIKVDRDRVTAIQVGLAIYALAP